MTLISSKQLVEKYNISYQTLNFYTNLGLFSVKKRVGNRRFFGEEETLKRLETINQLKEDGYPLRIIVRHLNRDPALGGNGDANGQGVL